MYLPLEDIPTPCFVVDESNLQHNLDILGDIQQRTGCKILLALKAFAMFSVFSQISSILKGTCASSPDEAQLGYEYFGGEVHTFAAAYSERDIEQLLKVTDHLNFNSFSQWQQFRQVVQASPQKIECGIRVNPEYSEVKVDLYNPCARKSRLGVTCSNFIPEMLDGISGLLFHTHCEQNADVLGRTIKKIEEKFGQYLPVMQWVNFGGGHLITSPDYDVDLLCTLISDFRDRYKVDVYLEPGEAVALNAGVLVSSVLDIIHNEIDIAILDTSATAHMPDVLEMPYRPAIIDADQPGKLPYTCRLGGLSCLAGDIIGDYSFAEPLQIGTKLVFLDMAHYTMVKTNTFNGLRLPSIAITNSHTNRFRVIRSFGYHDFKSRLS